jgi:hypothetical protein
MDESALRSGGFSQNVSLFLKRVTYRRATSNQDREAIFRLRYEANLREQTIAANDSGILTDDFDDAENGVNVCVLVDGELCASIRLHLLSPETPDSPLLHAYPEIMNGKLNSGARIVDITRLAADYEKARPYRYLPYATVRLSMLAAIQWDADLIMAGVRKEHIPFYRREFMAEQLTEPVPYPRLIKLIALFQIDYRQNGAAIIEKHPFHASTEEERCAIFGPARDRRSLHPREEFQPSDETSPINSEKQFC